MVEDQSTKVGCENAQSTTRHQATGSVQFDSDKVRTWVLPLMKRIYAGDYPTKAGRILGLSRSHVWYYIGKLEKAGLIYQEKRSSQLFMLLQLKAQIFSSHVRAGFFLASCIDWTSARWRLRFYQKDVILMGNSRLWRCRIGRLF